MPISIPVAANSPAVTFTIRDRPVDYIENSGRVALASRLKRLSHLLGKNLNQVYRDHGLDFDDRWTLVFRILDEHGPLSITQIARELRLTHPAVVQVAGELTRRRLLIERKDRSDQRVRLLKLSAKGNQLAKRLKPIWSAIDRATKDVLRGAERDIIRSVGMIEIALGRDTIYDRIAGKLTKSQRR